MKWTEDELESEWNYRYSERIGIMCGDSEPDIDQQRIAKEEADAAIQKLRDESI